MDLVKEIITVLKEDIDDLFIKEAKKIIESELSSDSFLHELNGYFTKIVNEDNPELTIENEEKNKNIVTLMLLGMARDTTIKILGDENLTRTKFERVRDGVGITNSKRKEENRRAITGLKRKSIARTKRLNEIAKVDWEKMKKEYINGKSTSVLSKAYNISHQNIIGQLIEENLFDETRSSITKNKIAAKNNHLVDDKFIIDLVKNNMLDSKDVLWTKAKKEYPWLLRNQMYKKMEELGLMRTKEEVNALRRIKSKTETNDAYMVKVNGYKAVKEVFGSIENLVDLYMKNKLGSFNKIADKINKEISFDYQISTKQVSKIITNHSSYVRNKSLGQQQLYVFTKEALKGLEVIEEHPWGEKSSNKQIDVYIPELKVGLEFNGEYWHSDAVIEYNYGMKAHEFHKKRADELKEKGIKLVYVWENDWEKNYKEVEKVIKNKDWDAPILNKYSNVVKRSGSYSSPNKKPSLLRNQIMRFLKENKIEFEKKNNSHIIELTNHKIVINVPNYNSLSNKKETLTLQNELEKEGIELLTFLPWRSIFKIKQFLSYRLKLSSIKKIPARKCLINSNEKITKEQRMFFAENHLLGYNNFMNIEKTITLEHEGEIVMAALFVKKPGANSVELKRLVSLYGVSVQGGASRLLKEYVRQNEFVESMYTFSDCDLGFGGVYSTIGFSLIERSKEQLNWYNEDLDMVFSNISLVRIGADRLLRKLPNYEEIGIGEGLPNNQEIVKAYGFIPIYDSGYKKWTMKIK